MSAIWMHKQLRAIGEVLKLDCGDSSCYFTPQHGGMRTNGGCTCDVVGAVAKLRQDLHWQVSLCREFQARQEEWVKSNESLREQVLELERAVAKLQADLQRELEFKAIKK